MFPLLIYIAVFIFLGIEMTLLHRDKAINDCSQESKNKGKVEIFTWFKKFGKINIYIQLKVFHIEQFVK